MNRPLWPKGSRAWTARFSHLGIAGDLANHFFIEPCGLYCFPLLLAES
jgi:hypothetical protein